LTPGNSKTVVLPDDDKGNASGSNPALLDWWNKYKDNDNCKKDKAFPSIRRHIKISSSK